MFRAGQLVRPAELGMLASLGIGEVTVYRKLRVAFFSTGDELKSIGTPLAAGEIYDSNRYTLHGMLSRLDCDTLDMGVVPDVPEALERAFASAAACADVVITSGGVSVGEADFVKQLMDKLGEVVFWKIAMKPGRPLAYGRHRRRALLRPARQSRVGDGDVLRVRAGRAQDPAGTTRRRAAADVQGAARGADPEGARDAPNSSAASSRRDGSGGWTVRTTGDQGSGILSSMSQANCFIVLSADTGNVAAGETVDVQLFEGLI